METKKLIDCCEFISDGDHLPPPKSDSGVPFITISLILRDKTNFLLKTQCLCLKVTITD